MQDAGCFTRSCSVTASTWPGKCKNKVLRCCELCTRSEGLKPTAQCCYKVLTCSPVVSVRNHFTDEVGGDVPWQNPFKKSSNGLNLANGQQVAAD